jgi:acyl-CoA synthetase (AMP-forming)/AMP-acid ligase II/NAD(P)-dependent dehydrogenase (short-subunit alcohol dehydrogenase family)
MSELLPRPIRLLLGATSRGASDERLRPAAEGKVVLITGASSGVGRAAALRLARAGATVLLVARREEVLQELRDEIRQAGGRAEAYPCDLADVDAVASLVDAVLADHGHVDLVVSNAGLSIRRWVSETYERFRDIERTINVNYLGPTRLLLGLLPSMRSRGSGHIIYVSTIGVNFPPIRWSSYIASKAAFEVWLNGVAPEIRADGVHTTSIQLQLVRSPMLGPFRMWNYLPGMSSDEAASIVARAVVERPRVISPLWARAGGVLTGVAGAPLEFVLSRYAARFNPVSRSGGPSPFAAVSTAAGFARPVRPDRIPRALRALRRYGGTPAGVAASAAALYPRRPAVIDENGTVTFGQLDAQAGALAANLHARFGLGSDDTVGVIARNHRGFVLAAVAATRLGCGLVPLSTDFAGPQLADVLARENVSAVVYDEEFAPVIEDSGFAGARILAWHDSPPPAGVDALDALGMPDGSDARGETAPPPRSHGRVTMLTSGTTGTPKGAVRELRARSLVPLMLAGVVDLGRIRSAPRSGDAFVVAPPLFHLYGLVGMTVAFGLGSPIVIRRRFEAERVLEQIDRAQAGVLLAVPTMLSRIMALDDDVLDAYDASSLRMIVSGAAPLSPELAGAVMDRFGEVLYNGYASTEVGGGTLATPADLRAAPGTVGQAMAGSTVKVLDPDGRPVTPGETGRIFVGSPLSFQGYTGGGTKEVIDGLMSTGDLGHFDGHGRLFIDGRDDDMILSGGENVFPQEVEDLLAAHPDVADAAVFGVSDEEFGQRLAAYVVLEDGASASPDELRDHVRRQLARHKVPREIRFVSELRRTSTGKLKRRQLSVEFEAETAEVAG